jgi:D-alanine-D-alanine ligase
MKITLLTYLEREDSKKYDEVVGQVAGALRKNDHRVSVLGVHGDLKKLVSGLTRRRPDLVFNLMEMFDDNIFGDVDVVAVLDLLRVPYTGGGPGEIYLQQDKVLAKKVLAYEKVKFPNFAVFSPDDELETGGHLHMPLFVKPARTDASIGITAKALVHDARELMRRVKAIHDDLKDAALAEEYIEGREFYVGVLGNGQATAFPPIEMDFSGLDGEAPHVLDNAAKWQKDSAAYKGTRAVVADLEETLRAKLQKAALDAFRALRVRDYGRVDLRLAPTGDIYVLEVNANCYLEQSSEFAAAAAAAGIEYPTLIEQIVQLAQERHRK